MDKTQLPPYFYVDEALRIFIVSADGCCREEFYGQVGELLANGFVEITSRTANLLGYA